jgi:glycosyltransferase involved in cell wall biosynthesis
MSDNSFSLIICNFNYGQFVGKAIESCLEQDYPKDKFEIIVTDDGSTDNSLEIINEFKELKVIQQRNKGQASAFYEGLQQSQNEFVCLLDSDDYFFPDKLKTLNSLINSYSSIPEYFFLCHDLKIFNEIESKYLDKSWFERIGLNLWEAEMIAPGQYNYQYPFAFPAGQVYSRKLIERIFEEKDILDWKRGVDGPLVHGAFLLADAVHYCYDKLAAYRIHGNNHFMGLDMKPKINYQDRTSRLISFLSGLHKGKNEIKKAKEYIENLESLLNREFVEVERR